MNCGRFLPFSLLFNIVIFIILLLVTVAREVFLGLNLRYSSLFKLFFGECWDILLDKDVFRDLVGEQEVLTVVEVEYFTWEVVTIDLVKGEISLFNARQDQFVGGNRLVIVFTGM